MIPRKFNYFSLQSSVNSITGFYWHPPQNQQEKKTIRKTYMRSVLKDGISLKYKTVGINN